MIGIDVGGANLKVVEDNSVHIHYCPLWESAPIAEILAGYGEEEAAVVMSGELADCFATKDEGIAFIVREVKKAVPRALFYGTDARFHDLPVRELAAANWLASADFLRERYSDAVFIDMGSTTTDIIPLHNFGHLLGLRDIDRLQQGYLVYIGLLRTNLAAMLGTVLISGTPTPLASEYFAVSADAHLVAGTIASGAYTVPTPDHAGTDRTACLRRLARVVCADLDEIGEEEAVSIARQAVETQVANISDTLERVTGETGIRRIVAAGIGAGFITRNFGAIDLIQELGSVAEALPAFAALEVMRRNG
jgi:probable H4MPT-linked C1 transfer pathway protein